MKKYYYSILLFFICTVYGTAQMQNQNSIFMANSWRLQKLEINKNIIPAPNNNELSFPKLIPHDINGEYQFDTEGCGGSSGSFYFVNNTELFIESYAVLTMMCNTPTNNIFSNIYDYDFFGVNLASNFSYIITNHTTYLELVIIGQNGNKAYYHNNLSASVNEVELKENIKLFPNPVTDIVFISGNQQILGELKEILIYDYSGKLVFQENIIVNHSCDISHLVSGNYIVYFKSNNQLLHYGLIVKK